MKRRPFTLIEVILASVMLMIAVVGSSSFYFANRRNLRNAQLRRSATWAAIDAMEELRAEAFDDLDGRDNTGNAPDQDILLDGHPALRIIQVEPGDNALHKKVTVTIEWNSSSIEFVTYVADY